jgi:uncharacterized protein (DUF433 family)
MSVPNGKIEIDPRKCHGRPVIRGTRVPVSIITGSLAGGMTLEAVAREYDVTIEDIQAALAYVTALIDNERHYPLAG